MAQNPKRAGISREEAEALAIEALTFIATSEDRLAAFIGITGLDLGAIRREAGTPEFLAAVLDFLMSDESLLLVFASHRALDPNFVALARRALVPNSTEAF